MMVGGDEPQYWDDVADDYDEEIMDTLAEDVTKCYTPALRDFVFAAPHDVEVERVDRVFYPWDTELNDVRIPRAEPRPYDCARL
ncbi:methyltransferase domain-containing protein [Aureococcus anophagefferens]|nr:methyltransferase domain-containing protein [Aureococcus anophagefferens]